MSGYHIQSLKEVPQVLTNKDWQKKKGLTKLTKSTGMGAQLDKLNTMIAKIDVGHLDPSSNPAPSNAKELQQRVAKAMQYYKTNVEPIRSHLETVRKVALETETQMKKAVGGGAAAKAAAKIADEAKSFSLVLKGLDMLSLIETAKKRIALRQNMARKELLPSCIKLRTALEKFLTSDLSFRQWDDNVKNPGRSVSQYVEELDAYNSAFWDKVKKYNGFDLTTLKADGAGEKFDNFRKKLADQALKLVKEIEAYKPG